MAPSRHCQGSDSAQAHPPRPHVVLCADEIATELYAIAAACTWMVELERAQELLVVVEGDGNVELVRDRARRCRLQEARSK